jgi:hypothetical protein
MYGLRNSQSTPNTAKPTTYAPVPPWHLIATGSTATSQVLRLNFFSQTRVWATPCPPARSRALLLQHDLAALVVDGDVSCSGCGTAGRSDVPRLAEHVGLLVLEGAHGGVVRLRRDGALDVQERLRRELPGHEAHLRERLRVDLRVLLEDREHQPGVGPCDGSSRPNSELMNSFRPSCRTARP